MAKLGWGIVLLIFGATAAMIAFLIYTILWDSSSIFPTHVILPLLRWL